MQRRGVLAGNILVHTPIGPIDRPCVSPSKVLELCCSRVSVSRLVTLTFHQIPRCLLIDSSVSSSLCPCLQGPVAKLSECSYPGSACARSNRVQPVHCTRLRRQQARAGIMVYVLCGFILVTLAGWSCYGFVPALLNGAGSQPDD